MKLSKIENTAIWRATIASGCVDADKVAAEFGGKLKTSAKLQRDEAYVFWFGSKEILLETINRSWNRHVTEGREDIVIQINDDSVHVWQNGLKLLAAAPLEGCMVVEEAFELGGEWL